MQGTPAETGALGGQRSEVRDKGHHIPRDKYPSVYQIVFHFLQKLRKTKRLIYLKSRGDELVEINSLFSLRVFTCPFPKPFGLSFPLEIQFLLSGHSFPTLTPPQLSCVRLHQFWGSPQSQQGNSGTTPVNVTEIQWGCLEWVSGWVNEWPILLLGLLLPNVKIIIRLNY